MGIKIREAKPTDFDRLEEILSQNDMLTSPKTDDKESMKEIYQRMGRYFIIAEIDGYPVGMIRGCYDGSRALIHQIVVDKKYQRQGIGKRLIYEIASRFRSDGAKTISVISKEKSKDYYRNLSFSDLPITLMICFDIDNAIKKTKPSNFN